MSETTAVIATPPVAAKIVTPTASVTQPPVTITQRVNAAVGATIKAPPSLKKGNTTGLADQSFFRFVLYSETSARKTSTAALFAGPIFTRIILTRGEDQLLPLDGLGYQYVHCPDHASLVFALRYPEQIWPDWAAMPDPDKQKTIIVDDATKGVQTLLVGNAAKDKRQAYGGAADDLDAGIVSLTSKPYNLGLIALAKVKENPLTNEERISPDLPPSMMNYILSEFAAVLFIKTSNWKLLTERDRFAFTDVDPITNKEKTFVREIFGKHKIGLDSVSKGIIKKEEPLDLKLLWSKIRSTKGQVK